jgi:archaellum biogenesis protein FlaJ (TadC family)
MGDMPSTSTSVAAIAAMVTPGLLMLGSASLAASALVRMARVVDRARVLAEIARAGTWATSGITQDQLRAWLERHAARARYAARSIALLYAAIVVFIATCLAIAADRAFSFSSNWLPLMLAIAGTLLLLGGAVAMVAESRLSGEQIADEIRIALTRLEGVRT